MDLWWRLFYFHFNIFVPEQLQHLHWRDGEVVDEDCDDCKEGMEEVDVDDEDHQSCSIAIMTELSGIPGHDYCWKELHVLAVDQVLKKKNLWML